MSKQNVSCLDLAFRSVKSDRDLKLEAAQTKWVSFLSISLNDLIAAPALVVFRHPKDLITPMLAQCCINRDHPSCVDGAIQNSNTCASLERKPCRAQVRPAITPTATSLPTVISPAVVVTVSLVARSTGPVRTMAFAS